MNANCLSVAECMRQLLSLSKNNWKKFSGLTKSLMLAPDSWSVTTDLPAGCCISFVQHPMFWCSFRTLTIQEITSGSILYRSFGIMMSNNSKYRDIVSVITVNQEETNRNSVLMKRDGVMRTMSQHLAKISTGAYVQINTWWVGLAYLIWIAVIQLQNTAEHNTVLLQNLCRKGIETREWCTFDVATKNLAKMGKRPNVAKTN